MERRYRKFKSDEGVENAKGLKDAAKCSCNFSDKLIELQKKLCKELWTHHNPYTKLRYCDDPVFVLAEIVNESELFSKGQQPIPEPYKTEFLAKFDKWLKENHTGKTSADFDLENLTEETLEELNKIYAK